MEESGFTTDRHHQRTPEAISGLQAETAVEVRAEQEDKAHHNAPASAKIYSECQEAEAGPGGEQAQQEDQQGSEHRHQGDRSSK